jgi:hypothetical protein
LAAAVRPGEASQRYGAVEPGYPAVVLVARGTAEIRAVAIGAKDDRSAAAPTGHELGKEKDR